MGCDILKHKHINREYIIEVNQNTNEIDENAKKRCKILKISAVADNLIAVLSKISNLNVEKFQHLFIFVVEVKNSDVYQEVENFLLAFSNDRPLILQITYTIDNLTKFFLKEKNSTIFKSIFDNSNDSENVNDFESFFRFFINKENFNFQDKLIEAIPNLHNLALILRLTKMLNTSDIFLRKIIFKCASWGSEDDLLAAFDLPFESQGRILSADVQNLLFTVWKEKKKAKKSCSDETESDDDDDARETSILLNAILSSNTAVFAYLIKNCTHLIQQLPFNHQVKISSTAYDNKKFDFLCDLVAISDFPFPKKFNSRRIPHERFRNLVKEREEFHDSIEDGNMEGISKFTEDNMSIRIAYNIENESALSRALDRDNYEVFFHLMSIGYRATEFKNYEHFVSNRRLARMREFAEMQTRDNAETALENENKSIQILSARSFIHNRKIDKKTEAEFRNKIKRWFRSIYNSKYGSKLLNAASQCENLRIIFDFECETVGNADLKGQESLGTTYTAYKWIFIGANSDRINREQIIKGIIAHEICHFVLRMIYQNNEKPYFAGDAKTAGIFDAIVKHYGSYVLEDSMYDDECQGIISSVYKLYQSVDHHAELIVRVPNILAQFDNNEGDVEYLENKHKILFEYYVNYVVPELEKFNLQNQEIVQDLNMQSEILKNICSLNYSFSKSRKMDFFEKQLLLIKTNIPMLLLANIHNHLYTTVNKLVDGNNVFIKSENLKNDLINRNLKEVTEKKLNISIFVYVSKALDDEIDEIKSLVQNENLKNTNVKLIFIMLNNAKYEKVSIIMKNNSNLQEIEENYFWKDLSPETQNSVLKSTINFQKNSSFSLHDILNDNDNLMEDFESIFDENLLNLLIEKSNIHINENFIDSKDKYFDVLFKPRNLLKCFENTYQGNYQLVPFNTNFSRSQLLHELEKEKYVLISDIAGTGKSWMLKNLVNVLVNFYPKKWISYIDLKQHINTFKTYKDDAKFGEFVAKNILKIGSDYEVNIFLHLYQNGKVILLFDGFDEIAPDYAPKVLKLIKSLGLNDGNQIWIATRDYFEINLKENLVQNVVFKLEPFALQESIDMIALSWILSDFEVDLKNDNKQIDFSKEDLENAELFKSYQQLAEIMIKKILVVGNPSIGYPQFYKMVAIVFKDKKDSLTNITLLKVYDEFVILQIRKWSVEKGELRGNASAESFLKSPNYREIHQFYALNSLFPKKDIKRGEGKWKEEELIACSFLIKIGDGFFFSHETFREYFAVDYIRMTVLSGGEQLNEQFCYILVHFLTVPRFGIVRIFLNEVLENRVVFQILEKNLNKIALYVSQNINDFVNISEIFEQNLENLSTFSIKLFKHFEYDKVEQIFNNNKKIVQSVIKNPLQFEEFQNFMFNNFNSAVLKKFMIDNNIILEVAYSHLDAKYIQEFLSTLSKKLNNKDLNEILKIVDYNKKNIFTCLTQTNHEFSKRFKIFFEFMDTFLSKSEMKELLMHQDSYGMNILHIVMEMANIEKLELVWTEIEKYFNNQNASEEFRFLFKHQTFDHGSTVAIVAANDPKDNIPFYESFWKLLVQTFKDKKELTDMLRIQNNYSISFIHWILQCNKSDAIKFTLEKLKENLDQSQFRELLRSKGNNERNLFQCALYLSKNIKTQRILWSLFRSTFEPNEFVDILAEKDANGDNVFNLAAAYSSSNVLEFIDQELEGYLSRDQIRAALSNLGNETQTLFHSAACKNKSLKSHQIIWKIIKKYFTNSELLSFVTHLTLYKNNFIQDVIKNNTHEVIELTWIEVKNILINNNCLSKKIDQCDKVVINKLKSIHSDDLVVLGFNWILNQNNNIFVDTAKLILEDKLPIIKLRDLVLFKSDDNINNHKILWNQLLRNFPNRDELKNLLIEKKNEEYNYIHLLVMNNKAEIIEFTLQKIKENLNEMQYEQILRSKGTNERNLLHLSALSSKEVETQKIFWNAFQSLCKEKDLEKRKEEFAKILGEGDKEGSNIFNLASTSATADILKYMVFEVINHVPWNEIKILLTNLNGFKQNMLQSAVIDNKCLAVHEVLWQIAQICYKPFEILEFVKHFDIYGKNLLISTVELKENFIIELTWKKVKETISSIDGIDKDNIQACDQIFQKVLKGKETNDEEKELLKLKWINNDIKLFDGNIDLLMKQKLVIKGMDDLLPFVYDDNLNNHKIMWEHVIKMLRTQNVEERSFHPHKNSEGNNILHLLVAHNKVDVIEFTFEKMRVFLREEQYKEIIVRRGAKERTTLQIAIASKRDIEIVKVIWNIFYNLYQSVDEFLNFLKATDIDRNNVFNLALCHPENIVFNMIITELKKIAPRQDIIDIFSSLNLFDQNILLAATKLSKNNASHELVWEVLGHYFKTHEIKDFINQCDNRGDNILHNAVIWNTKEIVELTWNNIEKLFNNRDEHVEFLERKGHANKNLYLLSFENQSTEVTSWVEKIVQEYNLSFLVDDQK